MKSAWLSLALAAASVYHATSLLVPTTGSSLKVAALQQDLQVSLHSLGVAVEQGDVVKAEELAASLLAEARRRAAPKPREKLAANLTTAVAPGTFAVAKSDAAASHGKAPPGLSTGSCILDDQLFSLSTEDKAALAFELQAPVMAEALTWTKQGGWWLCANYGETCTCRGEVRLANANRSAEAPQRATTMAPSYTVACDLSSFGNLDPFPGQGKMCECDHTRTPFQLHKRLTSSSLLQEAWIFLLRLLSRTKQLPLGTGDRVHHGIENWAARHVPGSMPMVLERFWIEKFMKQVVIPSLFTPGRCLEWGDPATPGSGFNYANMVPTCHYKMDVQYDAVHYLKHPMGVEANIVYSDVDNMPRVLQAQGDQRVDLIFATQVFEHLHNPHHAVKMLFDSLLPGGALVFTAPQQAQFHRVPHDFFRYTKEGVLYLLQTAGFCTPGWGFAGGGDFVFDIARDAGLQMQDFPMEEMEGGFQVGFEEVSDSAITMHALGFKPPHYSCEASPPR